MGAIVDCFDSSAIQMEPIYRDCISTHKIDVSTRTLGRWWLLFLQWGEIPHVVWKREAEMKKKAMNYRGIPDKRKNRETEGHNR